MAADTGYLEERDSGRRPGGDQMAAIEPDDIEQDRSSVRSRLEPSDIESVGELDELDDCEDMDELGGTSVGAAGLAPIQKPSRARRGARRPRTLCALGSRASDEDLMKLVKDDDRSAFDALYNRHRTAVYWLAMRILGNRELAADATQEAFVRLWRSRATYQAGRGRVKWWLMRIVRNGAIDLSRREHETVPLTEELFDLWVAPESVEDEVVALDEHRELAALLDQLPSKQREVLELAYFADLTQTEITKLLGLPRGTIKSRNRLGLEKLREALAVDSPEAWADTPLDRVA
jgi:RNA polymerase sigma-70 factor (ECF subfamily)